MNKFKIYFFLYIICSLFLLNTSKAAEPEIYIRPGLKIGYQFGKNGGFVYGFEVGLIHYKNNFGNDNFGTQTYLFGLITSIEFCNGNTKGHFGLELSTNKITFEIGPTIYNYDGEVLYGLTSSVNSLFLVTPYLEYTFIFSDKNLSFFQSGAFLKVPIEFGNRRVRFH